MLLHSLSTHICLLRLGLCAFLNVIIIFCNVLVDIHLRNFFVAVKCPLGVSRSRNVRRVRLVRLSLQHYSLLLGLTSCLKLDTAVVKVNDIGRNLRSLVPIHLASPERLLGGDDNLRVGRNVRSAGVRRPGFS